MNLLVLLALCLFVAFIQPEPDSPLVFTGRAQPDEHQRRDDDRRHDARHVQQNGAADVHPDQFGTTRSATGADGTVVPAEKYS